MVGLDKSNSRECECYKSDCLQPVTVVGQVRKVYSDTAEGKEGANGNHLAAANLSIPVVI